MKKAFTMLELVFVIVVMGILAALIIPSTKQDKLREAAIQLVSHIRYTQHLAMVDDKYDATDIDVATGKAIWFKGRWQIIFEYATTEPKYSVYSDSPSYTGNADVSETAVDPVNKSKVLSGGGVGFTSATAIAKINQKLNLATTYGITKIDLNDGCNNSTRISFDHLGRPLTGVIENMALSYELNKLVTSTCNIVLIGGEGNVTISIEPETGYAHII